MWSRRKLRIKGEKLRKYARVANGGLAGVVIATSTSPFYNKLACRF